MIFMKVSLKYWKAKGEFETLVELYIILKFESLVREYLLNEDNWKLKDE
jgi:hypothetical protein